MPVYSAALAVLKGSAGYIDRDEFDFFVSRVRRMDEVDWAVGSSQRVGYESIYLDRMRPVLKVLV